MTGTPRLCPGCRSLDGEHDYGPECTLEKWLAETAKECRSCPQCWDVPCGGCQQGAPCDEHCHCHRDGEDFQDDDRDEEDEP